MDIRGGLTKSSHSGLPRFSLHKHLLHTRVPLVKLPVELREILKADTVSDDVTDVEFARDDVVVEDLMPVEMDRRLSVPDEPDTLLHESTDVEVVGVTGVDADETNTTELLCEEDHLIRSLRDVGLKHERLLDLVKESLGLVESGGVDADWAI